MEKDQEKEMDFVYARIGIVDLTEVEIDYSINKPWIIDYIEITEPDIIVKETRISWDGKQYALRIPTEISKELKLSSGDKVEFTLTKPLPGSDEKPRLRMVLKNG